jgi:ACS family hexuronate transporter-like MFS transporter
MGGCVCRSGHAGKACHDKRIGIPFLVIYLVSDGGSVFFGWWATKFIGLGWSVNKARKITMLICALCVVPIFSHQ